MEFFLIGKLTAENLEDAAKKCEQNGIEVETIGRYAKAKPTENVAVGGCGCGCNH